jgi:uncharacterized membrane protein (Fun14 family)
MESLILPLLFMFIIGGFSGYFTGHLFKRVSRMALTIGIFAFLILYLIYIGTFEVKIDAITANIIKFFDIIGPLGLTSLVSSIPFVTSFIVGLFIGYRRY